MSRTQFVLSILLIAGSGALLGWLWTRNTTPKSPPTPPPNVQTWEYTPSQACGGGGEWRRVR